MCVLYILLYCKLLYCKFYGAGPLGLKASIADVTKLGVPFSDPLNTVKQGVDRFIIVDLPAEQSGDFHPNCVKLGLSLVPIVAPVSTPERMKMVADIAESFFYAVSMLGVTGARAQVSHEVEEVVAGVRKATEGRGITVPVGFGV